MKALFVTPVESGSGETITAIQMARRIVEGDGDVRFLASPFAHRLLGDAFLGKTRMLGDDGDTNRQVWHATIESFRPDAIVFADYPLFGFSRGASPLRSEEWERELQELDACLITLDHMGFAQRARGLFFGPPHLSFQYETIPAIPPRMHIMLPCPMHAPSPVSGRRGEPFRYWDVPLSLAEDERRAMRRRFLDRDDDYLVLHAAAPWAIESAKAAGIPYYTFLPRILDYYLADAGRPVTLVSVNDGELLTQPVGSTIRIYNLASLPSRDYDRLLLSADLLISENKISISLGKAICGLVPCVSLRNSFRLRELLRRLHGELREIVLAMEAVRQGSVFPYGVFPVGMDDELDQLGLYGENSIVRGFRELEIFGDESTRDELTRLLSDDVHRKALQLQQIAYVDELRRIDSATSLLAKFTRVGRSPAA